MERSEKPYQLIPFPKGNEPQLDNPLGHHKFDSNCVHGTLWLTLTVKTPVHISTGIVVLGTDIGESSPLIKTMIQGRDQQLIIPGSSLKGCIRSVYEVITNSTLGTVSQEVKKTIPIKKLLPCTKKKQLCPASRVFGASGKGWGWQGLVNILDAKCESKSTTGFIPSLRNPSAEYPGYYSQGKVVGRKFYYHTIRAIDKGKSSGIPVQQAGVEYTFITQLHFRNLQADELGALLIVLGQEEKYPLALKVGAGKPIGMGTMTVEVMKAKVWENQQDLHERYSTYTSDIDTLSGETLTIFLKRKIQQALNSKLVDKQQLNKLTEILGYPTNREPPEGEY